MSITRIPSRYRLWCIELGEEKCIISRDLTFDESKIALVDPKPTQQSTSETDGSDAVIEFEMPSSSSNADPIQDEDASQVEIIETSEDLQSYELARDRKRKEIKSNARYAKADLIYYAFCTEADDANQNL